MARVALIQLEVTMGISDAREPTEIFTVPFKHNEKLTGGCFPVDAKNSVFRAIKTARNAGSDWIAFAESAQETQPDRQDTIDAPGLENLPADVAIVAPATPKPPTDTSESATQPTHADPFQIVDSRFEANIVLPSFSGLIFRVAAISSLASQLCSTHAQSIFNAVILNAFPRIGMITDPTFSPTHTKIAERRVDPRVQSAVVRRLAARSKNSLTVASTTIFLLQNLFMNELSVRTKSSFLTPSERQEVVDSAARALKHIPNQLLLDYSATQLRADLRCLFIALKGETVPVIGHTTVRGPQRMTEVRYLYAGLHPFEIFHSNGKQLTPSTTKWRHVDYFGQTTLWERIIWLPTDEAITATVDSRPVRLSHRTYPSFANHRNWNRDATPPRATPPISNASLARHTAVDFDSVEARTDNSFDGQLRHDTTTQRSISAAAQSPYSSAWLLMDRVNGAGDNAEALFRYLRRKRPDINAWFVMDRHSKDFLRIREKYTRVLDYGSEDHFMALRNAAAVISSFVDAEMTHPVTDKIYTDGIRPWRFVYLQHGVLHNDLSLWFNSKPIDLMTTASRNEHAALVRDKSPYVLTSETVKLTGFPRHDRLVRSARWKRLKRRHLVLIAPTWRIGLMGPKMPDGQRPLRDDFASSQYAQEWLGAMKGLVRVVRGLSGNYRIAFLPHPNMREQFPENLVPEGVELVDGAADIDALLWNTKLLITDYSSMAFDAAVAGCSIAYFQFDRESALGGDHTYLSGDFDYMKHGLGPVVTTRSDLSFAVQQLLSSSAGSTLFRGRRAAIVEYADGHASERVTSAIEALLQD